MTKGLSDRPIGIFDSGVGGITVLRSLLKYLPHERFVYLGDTARVPYGNKSPVVVAHYARQCTRFLTERDAKLIVVACNTVSAVGLEAVEHEARIPVVGVVTPAATAAAQATRNRRIGVIGTRTTVRSAAYERAISKLAGVPETQIFSQPCPLFVPLVEEGMLQHPVTRLIAQEYLRPLVEAQVDTLILGCTHYPALAPLLHELLPDKTLIDCGDSVAQVTEQLLGQRRLLEPPCMVPEPQVTFFMTDTSTAFVSVAKVILGMEITDPHIVSLENLGE